MEVDDLITMSEVELIADISDSMTTIVYSVLKSSHDRAIIHGLTESGADEAVRLTIEKLYHAMREVDNGH